MKRTALAISAALLAIAVATPLSAQQEDAPAEAPAKPRPSAAEVARWIDDLDSDIFDERETATESLIAASGAAVEPLAAALPQGNLEVATRGVYILRQLAMSGEAEVEEAARGALEKTAEAKLTAAARRAAATLAALDELRADRAIAELRRLGATIDTNFAEFGGVFQESIFSIEIDEKWRGEESDLRHLKWISQAERITLSGDQVTDAWLTYIAEMPNLSGVIVKRASITNSGLAPLVKIKRLQELDLRYVRIGDEAVDHLQAMRNLTLVKVYGTDMTVEAARKLAADIHADVQHKAGAFLGVAIQPHQVQCVIDTVQPNSAAERANLESGDIIVKYGETRIQNFPELQAALSQDRAGDEITLEVVRGATLLEAVIDHRKEEPLGVEGKTHAMGVAVTKVESGSIAARMNLQPNDVIVRYQDEFLADPARLAAMYGAAQPDQKHAFEVARGGQILVKTVELGEWD